MMKFNFEKAVKNEEYARRILIDENLELYYDDYIFILSIIYASNINLEVWLNKFKENKNLFNLLLNSASIIHCEDWSDAINDILDMSKIINNDNNFKNNKESRNWVSENVSPNLLKIFYENDDITTEDVVNALSDYIGFVV